jgi:pleckstrin homology domain-containing family G member 4
MFQVNVKEQGRLLRQSEFLVWEGKGGKKSIRQVFLFEELVLFSKARRFPDRKVGPLKKSPFGLVSNPTLPLFRSQNLDIYIYKNSIKTSDIGLTAHVGDSKTKFEIWFRKRKPGDTWTLQCISEDVKNAWANEITNLLWNQAKRNREVRMAEMSSMGIGSKPCLDIRPSIDQINDRSISIFQLGKGESWVLVLKILTFDSKVHFLLFFFYSAPKFRNSFMGTLPEMKSTRRPNSIISLSSSSSSAGSSVSNSTGSSCGASLVSGENKHNTSSNTSYESSLIHHHVAGSKCNKHHHRSTTIVSQCSMGK